MKTKGNGPESMTSFFSVPTLELCYEKEKAMVLNHYSPFSFLTCVLPFGLPSLTGTCCLS
jgi:hypothetical protein